jgi:hypothetical protein
MSSPKRESLFPDTEESRDRVSRVIEECLRAHSSEPGSILRAALTNSVVPDGGSELQDFLRGPLAEALSTVLGTDLATETLFELEHILDGPITKPPLRSTMRSAGASWSEPPLDPEVERIYARVRRVEPLERADTEPPMPGRLGAPTLRLRQRRASDDWFTLAPVRVDDIPTLISKPITLAPSSPSEDATVILLDSRRRKRR